jgi:carboxypeptidase C (cathepsin A)
MRIALIAAAAALGLATPLAAQAPVPTPPTAHADEPGSGTGAASASTARRTEPDTAAPTIEETAQPRRRSIPLRGGTLAYTVTPGTLTIRNDEGAPIASMFYTAYTVDSGRGGRPRPLSFLFNGGPGSSSMWLHMGSFGPMKVDVSRPETAGPAPYRLLPNPDTLLDRTDLVFIDAVTTGLSRPLGKAQPKDFFGVDPDLDAFTRAVQRYLTIYGRWNSPKFLIGESYGTTRAAGLSYALQQKGVQLNGVALISTVLDFALITGAFDQSYTGLLPTYAATAWYHNRLANRPADLEAYLREVRAFAQGPYTVALAKGGALSPAERDAVARQIAAYTGLSPEFIIRDNLRVSPDHFRKELMRDRRRTVGRLDSRFVGSDAGAASDSPEYDPAEAAISSAFIGALNDYLFHDLGFQTPLSYRPNNYAGIGGQWDWKHKSPESPAPQLSVNTAVDLAAAMRQNPRLKLLSINGLYDIATPFFGAEYDLQHMALEPEQRANITYRYYQSGHMVYIEPGSARQLKADFSAFYDSAL